MTQTLARRQQTLPAKNGLDLEKFLDPLLFLYAGETEAEFTIAITAFLIMVLKVDQVHLAFSLGRITIFTRINGQRLCISY